MYLVAIACVLLHSAKILYHLLAYNQLAVACMHGIDFESTYIARIYSYDHEIVRIAGIP